LTVKNDKHDGQSQAAHASPQTARLAE
jgi:hypothetical protein